MRVRNMIGHSGREIANQFIIESKDGVYFQSYNAVIAFKPYSGKTQLDSAFWDYSRTTGKYRNLFLGETKKETERKIKDGVYLLNNLNGVDYERV